MKAKTLKIIGGNEMKRWGLGFLSIVMAAGIATGCSSNDDVVSNEASNNNQSGSSGDVVNLTVWHPESSREMTAAYSEIFEEFNEMHKGEIEVSYEFIPRGNQYAYEDQVSAAASSSSLPDLLSLDGPNVANYADSGIIQPIDGLVDNIDDFVDSVIVQGTFGDELYAIGPTESTVALFYNVEMLEEAGITPPTSLEDAWTWDEFYEAAKTLTDRENGIYGVNWTLDYGEWIIYFSGPTVWSNGGGFIAEDGSTTEGIMNSPETIEALEFLQKFAEEGLVNLQPTPTEFEDGNAAMMLMGSWQWENLKEYPDTEWGITYYPRSPKGEQVSPSGDWTWGMSTNTEHQEEAALLLNFLTNEENGLKLALASGKPAARKSAFDNMTEWNELPLRVLKDQVIETSHPRPRTTSYPVLSARYGEAVQNIFLGADVKEELDRVASEVERDIERQSR
jgi:fructooligosaccharide transport system substrate-binding protein